MGNIIFPTPPYADTIVPLDHLRVIESSIITAMLQSQEQYQKITTTLSTNDFVFQNHAAIFKKFINYSYDELCGFSASDMEKHEFGQSFLSDDVLIDPSVFYTIFSVEPSGNIDVDIQEMLYYSREKQKAIELNNASYEKRTIKFILVFNEGICTAIYTHNRLCEFHLTNAPFLPKEFCDTFSSTFENFIPYIENLKTNETSFNSCFEDPIEECTIILKVNASICKDCLIGERDEDR